MERAYIVLIDWWKLVRAHGTNIRNFTQHRLIDCHSYIFDDENAAEGSEDGSSISQDRGIIASMGRKLEALLFLTLPLPTSLSLSLSLSSPLSGDLSGRGSRLTLRYERALSHFISFESPRREQRRIEGVRGDSSLRGNHPENEKQEARERNIPSNNAGFKSVMRLWYQRDLLPFSIQVIQ